MYYQSIVTIVSTLLFSSLWVLILIKGQKNLVSRLFSWIVFFVFFFIFSLAMFYISNTAVDALFWIKTKYFMSSFIPVFFLLFIIHYPTGRASIRLGSILFFFVPNLIFSYLYYGTSLMVDSVWFSNGAWHFNYGLGHALFLTHFCAIFFCFYLRLLKLLSVHTGAVKLRLKYIMQGTTMALIIGGITNLFMPLFGNFDLLWIGPPLMLMWVVYINHVIYRFEISGFQLFIKRALAYSLTLTVMITMYFLALYLFLFMFPTLAEASPAVVTISALLVLALIFIPLRGFLQSIIEEVFFKGDYFKILEENEKLRYEMVQTKKYRKLATLFSRIVHEIKNPLTALKGYGQILPHKIHDKEFKEKFAEILVKEVDRIDNLLGHLSDYSNPTDYSYKETDMQKLIDESIDVLHNNLRASNIEVIKKFRINSLSRLQVDAKQMKQAVLTILDNAIDAMPNGGQLIISTMKGDESFNITFTDSGCGVAQEDLSHVFEPFFSRKENSLGLGLSKVKGIIEAHSGKIVIKSKVNVGTSIMLELPQ